MSTTLKNNRFQNRVKNPNQTGTLEGFGRAQSHSGELLQGIFKDREGQLVPGLVTAKCDIFYSKAHFKEINAGSVLFVRPSYKSKAKKAARKTLRYLGYEKVGGILNLNSNIPEKLGLGSSTCDVVATIRAIANATNSILSDEEVAMLAVAVEGASDSTMFHSNSILFAQRHGFILERFKKPIPKIHIVGFNTDSSNKGVDTLAMKKIEYTNDEIENFSHLRELFRKATMKNDPKLIGNIATRSSDINQKYLPKPSYTSIKIIMKSVGAVGLQAAHSGMVMGLMFDQLMGEDALKNVKNKSKHTLAEIGFMNTWSFSI